MTGVLTTLLTIWLIVAAIVATVLLAVTIVYVALAPSAAPAFSLRDTARVLMIALCWPLILFVGTVSLLADGIHFLSEVIRKPH